MAKIVHPGRISAATFRWRTRAAPRASGGSAPSLGASRSRLAAASAITGSPPVAKTHLHERAPRERSSRGELAPASGHRAFYARGCGGVEGAARRSDFFLQHEGRCGKEIVERAAFAAAIAHHVWSPPLLLS
jgi:hypothetical protein